jgi:large subunit ribosomal protein L25
MARRELTVQTREIAGKKVASLRRAGVLPGNIYGHGLESVSVQVETEVFQLLLRESAANEVIDVKVAGERAVRPVVIQRVQRHPLNSTLLHADFYQVSLREKMRADVPLHFTGTSEAVETYNGTLITSLEFLHVEALPLDLPAHIEVDISPLEELETSIHVRDISVPSNIAVLNDADVVIVKVAAPAVLEEEEVEEEEKEEEAEAAAEGEEPTAAAEETQEESAEAR